MALNWLGKTGAVRQFVAAVQAAATAAVDATEGSITLALGQAATGAYLWLQALAAEVLMLTRAATSFGTDLDSFFADFFFYRLGATLATGAVTFSRFTPTLQAVVPVGQTISTGPGGVQFIVTTDTGNAAYSATLNGYVLPPATASVTVPISAVTLGSAGNVLAGTITSFGSPVPGIDTVTNAFNFSNGLDAEKDPAFRARFQLYIAGLREGTVAAIQGAILAIQQGITCTILENVAVDGVTTDNGFLAILVDDGSGAPPSTLLNACSMAIDTQVRSAGIRYGVIGPTILTNVISATVVSINSAVHAADIAAATAATMAYVNSLPDGAALVWARLYQVMFDSSANISGVNNLLLNSGTTDRATSKIQVNKTASVSVA